jgi:Winged helix DNA-binding domain
VVYQKANLQIRPTLLLDGLVAGTWSIDVRRGEATLTLRPAGKLPRAASAALRAEGTGLLEALHPSAKARRVTAK